MAKISVDKDLCIGCGSCIALDADTFDFGDDGLAEAKNNEVTEATKEAASSCPTDAITIEEEN